MNKKPASSESGNGQSHAGVLSVDQHIVEIVSDSGEGAQKCGQIFASVAAKMSRNNFV